MLNWLETKLKDGGQKENASARGEPGSTSKVQQQPVMDEKTKLHEQVLDVTEQNKALRQQNNLLRDLEKKNQAELTRLNDELDKWKQQAFQMAAKASANDERSILMSPEYRKLESDLRDLLKLKEDQEKQKLDLKNKLEETEKKLKESEAMQKTLAEEAENRFKAEREALLLQIKEKEAEILALKKEKKEIDDKHNEMQHTIEVLREHVEGQQLEINGLSEQLSRQASLSSQTRSVTETHDIEVFRKKFGLPQTEFCIVYYACSYKGSWGYIYISPNFVCFEATFSSVKLVLAMVEIKALNKVKKQFIPTAGNCAELITRDGKKHQFTGLRQRKAALLDIYRQMVKSNILVTTLRDGKEEPYKLAN